MKSKLFNSSSGQSDENDSIYKIASLLLNRLERISADSTWAHRASGLRGALIRALDDLTTHPNPDTPSQLERLSNLIDSGFHIIEEAAREMRDE